MLNFKEAATAKNFFRAINNKVRKQIIELLQKEDECNVTELYTKCKTDQPSMSAHLRMLRKNKLVKTRHVGKIVYYSLNHEGVFLSNSVSKSINEFLL